MGRRVLRRHIWGYSVCLCPIKGTPGLKELTRQSSMVNSSCKIREHGDLIKWSVCRTLVGEVRDSNIICTWAPGYKTFFMLSSAGTKIYPAHKC